MHKLNQWITKPWAINTIYLVEMVKEIHTWRHRHQSVPDTSEDTATKVCQIQAKTPPPKCATYSKTKKPPPKCSRFSQVETLPPKFASYSQVKTPPRKCAKYSQVKTPSPKCATYSRTSHRHQSVPDNHKWKHCHHLASHVHLTFYLSICRSVRLKTADYNGCRLNMLSFFLIGPKRQIVDATNSG